MNRARISGYVPELDGLRAFAAIAVVVFHASGGTALPGGYMGVDIFFVLSAFLITALLDNELRETGKIDLSGFYINRFLRLVPALLLMLTVYVSVAPWLWPNHNHLADAFLSAAYLSDYSYAYWHSPFYLRHTWSLAVEEHFYLIWPLILPVMIRTRRAVLIAFVLYVACFLWRADFDGGWLSYYYRFDTRATGLLAGALLYFLIDRIPLSSTSAYLAAGLIALLMVGVPIPRAAAAIPFAELAAVVLIGSIVLGRAGVLAAPLRSGPATWLGKRSYAIYLWHFPVAFFVRDKLPANLAIGFTLAVAVAAAAVSYVTVEAIGRHFKSAIARRRGYGAPSDHATAIWSAPIIGQAPSQDSAQA